MSVPAAVVVVPWMAGCRYRERNWRWLQNGYTLPTTEAHGSPPWVKARAVTPELRRLRCEIVVVADADVLCPNAAIDAAVREVRAGRPWAMPHTLVRRLTDHGTEALIARGERGEEEERPYVGVEGGGIVVARRTDLLRVPPDPRFVGWGHEDECWALALRTLLGPPWRGAATLTHLWHPPQPRASRSRGSLESWRLRKRYYRALHDPDATRRLIGEARHALGPAQPAVPDNAAAAVV